MSPWAPKPRLWARWEIKRDGEVIIEPIAIRASSLPTLFDCPARFEATQLRGLRTPSSGPAVLGKAVHASTAVYDLARLQGSGLTPDEAAGAAVDVIQRPEEEVAWDDGLSPQTAENIAIDLHRRYCDQIAPASNYVAVEVTCEALTVTDLGLTLTGTVDRIYQADDQVFGITDLKTGKQAVAADGTVRTGGHAYQVGVYELLAEAAIGRPIEAPAHIVGFSTGKTERGQRVGIGRITKARESLIGDGEFPGALETAAGLIHRGLFHGNPKSLACHARYCPIFSQCKYRR